MALARRRGVVVAAFVAANVWLYLVRSNNDATESAREDRAMTSARDRVPAMLSYKYTDITDYVSARTRQRDRPVQEGLHPAHHRGSSRRRRRAQKIVTNAQVKSAGVIEAHADSVVVLVMLDQTTTSKNTKGARVDGSRVRVVMTRTGSTWLVSSLTPI